MNERWLKEKIRNNAKVEKVFPPIPDKPFLTKEETATCVGVSVNTIIDWVNEKVIPKPRKWGHVPAKGKVFRRSYVEGLRDCIVIRNSTTIYHTLEEFRKLAQKRLLGIR